MEVYLVWKDSKLVRIYGSRQKAFAELKRLQNEESLEVVVYSVEPYKIDK